MKNTMIIRYFDFNTQIKLYVTLVPSVFPSPYGEQPLASSNICHAVIAASQLLFNRVVA